MYVINRDRLKPFDIILFRFPEDRISKLIRKTCNSEYSHAVVYIGDDSFIEGIEPVVTLFSTYRYAFNDLENLQVLRLKREFSKDFDISKAEKSIRGLAYCNYNNSLLSSMRHKNLSSTHVNRFKDSGLGTGGVVCSTMISIPYYAGGIDISKNDEPYYVDFGKIERSDFFEDVTKDAFMHLIGKAENGIFDYFAMTPTHSLLEKQASIVHKLNLFVEKIFKELKKDANNYPELNITDKDLIFSNWEDVYQYINLWFETNKGEELDSLIYNEIITSGYKDLWFEEVHSKRELYFPFYFILPKSGASKRRLESKKHYELSKVAFDHALLRMSDEENSIFGNFSVCPSKTFHLLLDMYRSWTDLLRSTIKQYEGIINEYDNVKLVLNEINKDN